MAAVRKDTSIISLSKATKPGKFHPRKENCMKDVTLHEYGAPEVLRAGDAPLPKPGSAQILIKVAAASWKL